MRIPSLLRAVAGWLTAIACLSACPSVRTPILVQSANLPVQTPKMLPLKVHLVSGDLLILTQWREWPGDSGLTGIGTRYDVRRRRVGPFDGPMHRDSIALLEVTQSETAKPAGSILLGAYTVLAGAATVYCLNDPKACFGSCPTFYLDGADDRPAAEGFSASVARAFEATDVDDLGGIAGTRRTVILTMRNEALETHSVRSVRLLAARRPATGTVMRSADGRYFVATRPTRPVSCRAGDGDCTQAVADRDGNEWSTRADSTDLGAPDSLDLLFPDGDGDRALLLAARQSFISTYVFYQALAYAGSQAGDLLAEVERRGTAVIPGAWQMLGTLTTVEVWAGPPDGEVRPMGVFGEPGPIATDQQVIPLPDLSGPLLVRLRFTRGAWRFDRLAMVTLQPAPPPVPLDPVRLSRGGLSDTAAHRRLLAPDRYLHTGPGDTWQLEFTLPDRASLFTFFLETRGYYYEWMRPEWLQEENAAMLALVALAPDAALRRMAPGYARLEPRLEELFWASRFGRRETP